MIPYKCPICGGKGIVPGGFYISVGYTWSSNCTTEKRRQCNGQGIIWSNTADMDKLSGLNVGSNTLIAGTYNNSPEED